MRKVRGTKANKNERMIEIKLRFWTNGFATRKGYVRPKHAWSSGVVRIERNDTHGIRPVSPKPFHTLLDVGTMIERVLIAHGIVLHSSKRMKKYVE
jgi:hypothetical protein